MSKNQEIKKLKERIEELEFVKDFQQDIIADFENVTGPGGGRRSVCHSAESLFSIHYCL